jgi:hypothetical protein
LGLNIVRQENLPSSFRRRLAPWDMKSEVNLCAAFRSLPLDEPDDQFIRLNLDARNVSADEAPIIKRGG